jgi:hypothetical protein
MTSPNAQILNLLADGQISPEEAAARMRGDRASSTASAPASGKTPAADLGNRWLHIRVTDVHTGRPRVNVNVPLTWVALGLQLGSRHVGELHGIDLNELLDQIRAGANGRLIEVEDLDDGERVEIFVD